MATHDAACSLRYNPLRNGYLGDKIGVFERKNAEFILSVLSALFLPKSSPAYIDDNSIFCVFNHLTQSVFAVVWRYKQEMRALKVSVHLLLAWSGAYIYPCVMDG